MLISKTSRQAAFTLLEVIIAIAIIAILAAAIVPSTIGSTESKRITQTAADFTAFKVANGLALASTMDRNLGRVSFASINPTAADTTSCNGLLPSTSATLYAGNAASWAGPYMNRANSRQGGFVTGIGVIRDIVRRSTINTTQGDIVLAILNVRLEDAIALNVLMDNDGSGQSNNTGSIRYPLPNSQLMVDSVTYQFAMTENKC